MLKYRLAVFVSGSGTDLQSIIDAVESEYIENAEISLVVGSKEGIFALERAKSANIPTTVYKKDDYNSLSDMFEAVICRLEHERIDYIVLAGYLLILTPNIVSKFRNRIINIHPSLIPNYCGDGFYGMRVHKAVIAAGEKFSGATVHFVDEGTDTGDIILQEKVPVLDNDTADTLAQRVLKLEHSLLPKAIKKLLTEKKMKKRALISVSDKTGIVEFSKKLVEYGYEIISTGGTAKTLSDNGIAVIGISDITGFPECLDGRVKTLHPNVHAGLLAMRSNAEHMVQLQKLKINTIDIVVVNLYPFKATIMKEGVELQDAIENIDIGGPTMLRSAAKNYQDVAAIVDPKDYEKVITELENGGITLQTKFYLMYKVYQHTAVYDTLISTYLREKLGIEYPDMATFAYEKVQDMRYGENPHQSAVFYREALPTKGALTAAKQLNGKELSYNNINDANGALELLKEFDEPTVVAVKHANPCGVASAKTVFEAYNRAYECDPVSIYGGIVAINAEVDAATAKEMIKIFLEIVIAPSFTDEALAILKTKPNLRVLELADIAQKITKEQHTQKKVLGGLLVQSYDASVVGELNTVTKSAPTAEQIKDMIFGMKVVKHTKSNAIVVVKDGMTLGIGAGQTNRIWATKQAIEHAGERVRGAILASDAFFPFNDCVDEAHKAGISAIIQPGGSIRDKDSIESSDKYGISMVFSGERHFKH